VRLFPASFSYQLVYLSTNWLSLVGVVAEGLISPSLPFVKEQDLTILKKLYATRGPNRSFVGRESVGRRRF
jgi:hypothetical protein